MKTNSELIKKRNQYLSLAKQTKHNTKLHNHYGNLAAKVQTSIDDNVIYECIAQHRSNRAQADSLENAKRLHPKEALL